MILIYIIIFHEKQHQHLLQNQYIYIIFTHFVLFKTLYQHFKHFVNFNSVDFPLIKPY